jgi:hypothetical protein
VLFSDFSFYFRCPNKEFEQQQKNVLLLFNLTTSNALKQ